MAGIIATGTLGLYLLLCALTILVIVWLLDQILGVGLRRLDEGVNLLGKFLQMNEGVADHKQEREIERDKVDVTLEATRQKVRQDQDRADMALLTHDQKLKIEAK